MSLEVMCDSFMCATRLLRNAHEIQRPDDPPNLNHKMAEFMTCLKFTFFCCGYNNQKLWIFLLRAKFYDLQIFLLALNSCYMVYSFNDIVTKIVLLKMVFSLNAFIGHLTALLEYCYPCQSYVIICLLVD